MLKALFKKKPNICELAQEFERYKKHEIQKNYFRVMNEKIIPFVRDSYDYQRTEEQIQEEAQERFSRGKKDGKIDHLNLVTFEEDFYYCS